MLPGVFWKKIGRRHVIIDAQFESLRKAIKVKPHSFSVVVLNFFECTQGGQTNDQLKSNSFLHMAVDRLAQIIRDEW